MDTSNIFYNDLPDVDTYSDEYIAAMNEEFGYYTEGLEWGN